MIWSHLANYSATYKLRLPSHHQTPPKYVELLSLIKILSTFNLALVSLKARLLPKNMEIIFNLLIFLLKTGIGLSNVGTVA